jgi:YidC/Oxa1 family membrane protein insertase
MMLTSDQEMGDLLAAFAGIKKYYRECQSRPAITFYSEGRGDWTHFEDILGYLLDSELPQICWLTSDLNDPAFARESKKLTVCYIGMGSCRTWLFNVLKSPVVIMTMPDLDSFHLKRSRYRVEYVYVFHSLNSIHMAYRPGAFDAFDTIFCTGHHHVEEIRATERLHGQRSKNLIAIGYPRLDRLIEIAEAQDKDAVARTSRQVVIAPTWGPTSLIDQDCRTTLISGLLSAGWEVTLRLHPMTVRHRADIIQDLRQRFGQRRRFHLQLEVSDLSALANASLMISDWSGAALEYALGLARPVLFIDTPPKVKNPEYKKLNIVPFEVRCREEIGTVVPLSAISQVPEVAAKLIEEFRPIRLRGLRDRAVYNSRKSARVAADYLLGLVNSSPALESVHHPPSRSL